MTQRRNLEHHRHSLAEIRDIMNSMKTLAYMETRKLGSFLDAQHTVLQSIEEVAAGHRHERPAVHVAERRIDPLHHRADELAFGKVPARHLAVIADVLHGDGALRLDFEGGFDDSLGSFDLFGVAQAGSSWARGSGCSGSGVKNSIFFT